MAFPQPSCLPTNPSPAASRSARHLGFYPLPFPPVTPSSPRVSDDDTARTPPTAQNLAAFICGDLPPLSGSSHGCFLSKSHLSGRKTSPGRENFHGHSIQSQFPTLIFPCHNFTLEMRFFTCLLFDSPRCNYAS